MEFQWQALVGGMLIGLSAIILFASMRKIAGISGMVKQVLTQTKKGAEGWWPLVFLVSLMIGTWVYSLMYSVEESLRVGYPKELLVASGLLVGIGTYIGKGCTSGHGVCGIGRLSKRSIVATMLFMVSAIITVAVVGSWT
ncbi:YeeE/YedE family protein [Kangiella taiwanensis]|uniref:YeeE/YedE family protein n=1 Tax=Kangiella taiwanensis TaxID=1079179 RepID=A0ABP8HWW9_9GAMM|nr:YeeE/YedE family protein [Kangiella taiwanensis]